MTKTKFVKRYPRAVVLADKDKPWQEVWHLLRHPGETPNWHNTFGANIRRDRHKIMPIVINLIDTHRSEPS